MTWRARTGRAGVFSLLAVGWALAGHLWASAAHGPPPAVDVATTVAPVLWAVLAVGLLGWLVLPAGRATGPGQHARRAVVVGGVLGIGQLLAHTALSVAPLLAGQVRQGGLLQGHGRVPEHVHGHVHGAVTTAVTGAPDADTLLAAVTHGGGTMLLAHSLATVAAALAWALAGAVWEAVAGWLRRITIQLTPVLAVVRAPGAWPPAAPRALAPQHSWEVRGPPRAAPATGAASPPPAFARLV